jgi:hypothetical protein
MSLNRHVAMKFLTQVRQRVEACEALVHYSQSRARNFVGRHTLSLNRDAEGV